MVGCISTLADRWTKNPEPTFRDLVEGPCDNRYAPCGRVRSYVDYDLGSEKMHTVTLDLHGQPRKERVHLLLITWFQDTHGVLRYRVMESGEVHDCRLDTFGRSARRHRKLSDDEFTAVKALASTLPESIENPPIHRTVLVSFQVDGNWVRSTYDADHLPRVLEAILAIIGERFETKGRLSKGPSFREGGFPNR